MQTSVDGVKVDSFLIFLLFLIFYCPPSSGIPFCVRTPGTVTWSNFKQANSTKNDIAQGWIEPGSVNTKITKQLLFPLCYDSLRATPLSGTTTVLPRNWTTSCSTAWQPSVYYAYDASHHWGYYKMQIWYSGSVLGPGPVKLRSKSRLSMFW